MLVKMAIIKKKAITNIVLSKGNIGKDVEKRKPLCTVGGNGNWTTHYGNVALSVFPDASVDKESTRNAGDLGSNPGL